MAITLNGTTGVSLVQDATVTPAKLTTTGGGFTLPCTAGNGLVIDSSGRVTTPYQPAFHVTVNNNNYINTSPVPFANAYFDTGSNFNTSTYRFTAPVSGKYFFVLNMYLKCNNNVDAYPRFRVNGVNKQYAYFWNNGTGGQIDVTIALNSLIDLNAGDYVDVSYTSASGQYYGGNTDTGWYGYLVG